MDLEEKGYRDRLELNKWLLEGLCSTFSNNYDVRGKGEENECFRWKSIEIIQGCLEISWIFDVVRLGIGFCKINNKGDKIE